MKYYVYDGNNTLRDVRQYEEIFLCGKRIIGYKKNNEAICIYTDDNMTRVEEVFNLIVANMALN